MIDDAIRQFAEPPRQPGARVPTPVAPTTAIATRTVGEGAPPSRANQRRDARTLNVDGPAETETGNVWHWTPQLEMEIGVFREQAYVLRANGAIVIDPRIANVWNVSLAGAATISFAAPPATPQPQLDAGRDRNTVTPVVLRVIRNGFTYAFQGVEVPLGTADRVTDDANRDKWVADWWGGPDLGSNWDLQLVASGYEAG